MRNILKSSLSRLQLTWSKLAHASARASRADACQSGLCSGVNAGEGGIQCGRYNTSSAGTGTTTGAGLPPGTSSRVPDAYGPLYANAAHSQARNFMPRPVYQPKADSNVLQRTAMLLCASGCVYIGARAVGDHDGASLAGFWTGLSRLPSALTFPVSLAQAQVSNSSQPQDMPLQVYAIADAAAKAAPAVVNILLESNDTGCSAFSSGSGFIFDANGTIMTNAHVVSEPSHIRHPLMGAPVGVPVGPPTQRALTVTLQDGRAFQGRVIATDAVTDLAVVKIDSPHPLPAVQLGSSATVRVGEWVVALGSPLHLQNSVTHGIVSCVDRKASDLGLVDGRTDYLQTDAAINTGNSGGPLVNLQGEVIGISCLKALSADGVSFAIPVDTAKEVAAQLLKAGRVIRPYVGIKMLQLTSMNVKRFRERDPDFPDVVHGILVTGVSPGSPAEKAGMTEGDIIVGFKGNQHEDVTTSALVRELQPHVGKTFTVKVQRAGKQMDIAIPVAEAQPLYAAGAPATTGPRGHGTDIMQHRRRVW